MLEIPTYKDREKNLPYLTSFSIKQTKKTKQTNKKKTKKNKKKQKKQTKQTKQNKTKQNKTKQNQTKQIKTKQNQTKTKKKTKKKKKKKKKQGLMKTVIGREGEIAAFVSSFLFCFGTCLAYLIFIGNNLSPILSYFFSSPLSLSLPSSPINGIPSLPPHGGGMGGGVVGGRMVGMREEGGHEWFMNKKLVLIFYSFLLMLPLCCLKRMKELSYTCLVSIGCICYLSLTIFGLSFWGATDINGNPTFRIHLFSTDIIQEVNFFFFFSFFSFFFFFFFFFFYFFCLSHVFFFSFFFFFFFQELTHVVLIGAGLKFLHAIPLMSFSFQVHLYFYFYIFFRDLQYFF